MKRKIARFFLELMRHHITAMAAISVVNMILIIAGSKYIVYFSTLLPQFLTARGFSMAITSGYAPLESIAVVLSGVFVALLVLTSLFSYKQRAWHLVAAGLVLADLSIAFYMLFGEGNMSFIPDVIINGYVVLVSVGAFFVSGALYPRRRVKRKARKTEEEAVEAHDGADDLIGYGEYLVSSAPAPQPVAPEAVAEEACETVEEPKEASAPAEENDEKSELESGVFLKVTFRLPTLKSVKEALGIVENEDEEE